MEKLIHKSDGTLEPDDPFTVVGKQFYHLPQSGRKEKVVVTEESIEKTKGLSGMLRDNKYLCFVERPGQPCLNNHKNRFIPID